MESKINEVLKVRGDKQNLVVTYDEMILVVAVFFDFIFIG